MFEWKTAVQLPADGLPTVGQSSVYYQVKATTKIRGWPDPSKAAKVKTVSARLATEPAHPQLPSPQETSGGLVFLAKGQPAPEGVDITTTGSGIWRWILLCFAGLGLGIPGVALWVDKPSIPFAIMGIAGALVLVLSLVGFFFKLFR